MIDRPLKADGLLAAKNATKIRAALTQVTNFKSVFERYKETHPEKTDNQTQDRARARAWVMLNVGFNNDALHNAVMHCWAEGYVLGTDAGTYWLEETKKKTKALQGEIDWDNWTPGDRATALLVKPVGGFQKYLEQTNSASYFKNFDKETVEMLGTALSDSIAAGLDASSAALLIKDYVGSPGRALTIAITEQTRAFSFGTVQRYKEAGIEKYQWNVSDPCDKCAQNAKVTVQAGGTFPSGNSFPPAHPHCKCRLLPVVPGLDEEAPLPGAETTPMPTGMAHTGSEPKPSPVMEAPKPPAPGKWQKGNWSPMSRQEIRESQIDQFHKANPRFTREQIIEYVDRGRIPKADIALITKGQVYKNGDATVQFYYKGANLADNLKQEFLNKVDELQTSNPIENLIVTVGSDSSSKYGWATTGGNQVWITPTTAKDLKPNTVEGGGFKMPVLLDFSQRDYTLAHEWGHLLDRGGNTALGLQNPSTTATINRLIAEHPDAFRSTYSGKNTKEFYAEMFSEWWLTKGQTTNTLVQAMAEAFAWQK